MSKIVITIEDDADTGGVIYQSKCDNMTLKDGEPSAALIVAQTVLDFMNITYNQNKTND
jgi:hypothetical protein